MNVFLKDFGWNFFQLPAYRVGDLISISEARKGSHTPLTRPLSGNWGGGRGRRGGGEGEEIQFAQVGGKSKLGLRTPK